MTNTNRKSLEHLEDKILDQKDFQHTLVKFSLDEPFYAAISRQIQKYETKTVPTAAVSIENGKFLLKYNKEFFDNLKWYQKQELLKHEFLHLILGHCSSRAPVNVRRLVWNFAIDFATNSLLDIDKLPPGGLYPGIFPDISDEIKKNYTPKQLIMLENFSNLIRSFPVGETAEWYYDKLKNNEGMKYFEENQSLLNGFGTLDEHAWDSISDEEREIIELSVKDILKKAIDYCDSNNRWGTFPSNMQSNLRKLVSRVISWKDLLRNFISRARSLKHTRTIKRIDKRYPYIHPGVKRDRRARIAVAIDESGSVSDTEISLFFSELTELSKITEFVVIPFDSKVREDKVFVWKQGMKYVPERVACGGTDFNIPTKWVNKRYKEFDGFIIMTDGGCDKPIPSKLKRAFIIAPNRKLFFNTNEIVINMNLNSCNYQNIRNPSQLACYL